MDTFNIQLNNLLVDTFRSVLKVEEQILKSSKKIDLSISEMHLIESVGKNNKNNKEKTISEIAEDLGITPSSVTIAINKLVKKGYVQKIKSENDARVVKVALTKQGKKVDAVHKFFHENMVRAVSKQLSDTEKQALVNGIKKLNKFFERKLEE